MDSAPSHRRPTCSRSALAPRFGHADNDHCKSGCAHAGWAGQAAARRYTVSATALSRSVRADRPTVPTILGTDILAHLGARHEALLFGGLATCAILQRP